MPEKAPRILLAALGLLIIAACSTPDSRIDKNQAAFDQYPPDVQQQIRAGNVSVGFTPEMVQLALGNPTYKTQRTDSAGDTEVWGYQSSKPTFSFGFGGGGGSGGFASGGGVGIGTGGRARDKIRVLFKQGHVSSIERNLP